MLGEGPIWYGDLLYWVDIDSCRVWISEPEVDRHRMIQLDRKVGTVVPRESGGLVVALADGFAFLDPETEELLPIGDPEAGFATRFNDGKCDPAGRFWAGTMATDGTSCAGSLYVLDRDLQIHRRLSGVSCSNGICWSLDAETMYYIDTPTRQVAAFDYDLKTGTISRRRPVIAIDKANGSPDGMTMDANGNLWIALWGGWGVVCYDPRTGLLKERIEVPASRVTACAFGGEKLDQLFITTARVGLADDEEPEAGGLFVADVGVRGLPATTFSG